MSALIVVKRNTIISYFSDRDESKSVAVSSDAIADMEILNEVNVEKMIHSLLGDKPQKPSVQTMLILDDELCFSEQTTLGEEEKTKEKLTGIVPFVRVATTTIHVQDAAIVVAANVDLYEALARLLRDMGYYVSMVLPWAAIVQSGVSAHGELDRTTVRRVFDAQATLKPMSFAFEQAEQSERQEIHVVKADSEPPKKKLGTGWIIFISVALVYVVVMLLIFVRK